MPTVFHRSELRTISAIAGLGVRWIRGAIRRDEYPRTWHAIGRRVALRQPIPASVWISVQTGAAAAGCFELARLFELSQGYWAGITAVVVLQSDYTATRKSASDRVVGTAIGALLGWLFGLLGVEAHAITFGIAVSLAILLCHVLKLENAARISGLTVTIVMLVHSSLPFWKMALFRFLEISLGVIVAVSVSWCAARLQRAFPGVLAPPTKPRSTV